jgi:hypothetical protein
MAYRRKGKDLAHDVRRWQAFREENRSLLEDSGLARYVYESDEVFADFLMHGCVDHHPSPYPFDVRELTEAQVPLFREIVIRYLAAGFGDPGMIVFDVAERDALREEADRRLKEAESADPLRGTHS